MCPRRFINANTCAPVVRGVDSGAGGCMCGDSESMRILCLLLNFAMNLKLLPKK